MTRYIELISTGDEIIQNVKKLIEISVINYTIQIYMKFKILIKEINI